MVAIVMSIMLGFFFVRLSVVAVQRRSRTLGSLAGVTLVMAIRPIQGAFAAPEELAYPFMGSICLLVGLAALGRMVAYVREDDLVQEGLLQVRRHNLLLTPPSAPVVPFTELVAAAETAAKVAAESVRKAAFQMKADLEAELQAVKLERLRLSLENKRLKRDLQSTELERLRLALDLKATIKAADQTAQEDFQERQEIVATLVARAEEAESLLRRAKAAGGLLMAEKKAAEAELEAMKAQQGLTAVVLGGGFMREWEIPHPAVTTAEGWVAQWAITPDNK